MGKEIAASQPSQSIPELPRSLNGLLNRTGNWSEEASALTGWKPPDHLAPSWKPILSEWIAKLEAALAPMTRHTPTKQGLAKLLAMLPSQKGDSVQDEIWLRETFEILKGYPESVVIDALNRALRKFEWRPSPKQLLDLIEPDMAGPRDELDRMRKLLDIASKPALPPPPPETAEQRASTADAAMARHREWLASQGLAPNAKEKAPPSKLFRRYWVPGLDTPREATLAWLAGFLARRGCRDMPRDDAGIEGYVAAAGFAAGELHLPDWIRDEISPPPSVA